MNAVLTQVSETLENIYMKFAVYERIKYWLTCSEDVSALRCRLVRNPSDLGYQDHCKMNK